MKVVTKENFELYDSKLKEFIDNTLLDNLDLLSYGVSWKPNVGDPHLTRVGNMTYHKTLPIQNNMRGCIALMKDGAKIMYYLNPNDWRFRTDEDKTVLENQTLVVTSISTNSLGDMDDKEYIHTLTNSNFSNLRYEHQYVKLNDMHIYLIGSIDTDTQTATLVAPRDMLNYNWGDGTYSVSVELGAVLNGYDGEVMVEVPEFWIKSWDTDTRREVRISPMKIDDTWEHQSKVLVSPYHDTVLNKVPADMGYLSTLPVNSAVSICNVHDYCRGGMNDSSYDKYLDRDPLRSLLGKPRTSINRSLMRVYCRNSGKEILSYLQYKRIFYWLYVIEYANFNSLEEFNRTLTAEGYRQGGLGDGVLGVNLTYLYYYNMQNPLVPNGDTNSIGNGTDTIVDSVTTPTTSDESSYIRYILYIPRWHGIENPFGDIWTNLDGVLINSSSIVENGKNYSEVYATNDPSLYSDGDYKNMNRVGIELNEDGYTKEWALGDTAEIIPRLNGGTTTQYKCDHHWVNTSKELRTLLVGGTAHDSANAGLGLFGSHDATSINKVSAGFRSSCVIK